MSEDGQPDEAKEWEDLEHSEQDIYQPHEHNFEVVTSNLIGENTIEVVWECTDRQCGKTLVEYHKLDSGSPKFAN